MIGRALKLVREFHRLSQVEAARRLTISNSYLSEIEKGSKQPTLELIERYAAEFKIPASSILFFSETLANGATVSRPKALAAGKILRILEWIADDDQASKQEHSLSD